MNEDAVSGDDARACKGGRLREVSRRRAEGVNSVRGAWLKKSEAPSAIAWRRA